MRSGIYGLTPLPCAASPSGGLRHGPAALAPGAETIDAAATIAAASAAPGRLRPIRDPLLVPEMGGRYVDGRDRALPERPAVGAVGIVR